MVSKNEFIQNDLIVKINIIYNIRKCRRSRKKIF